MRVCSQVGELQPHKPHSTAKTKRINGDSGDGAAGDGTDGTYGDNDGTDGGDGRRPSSSLLAIGSQCYHPALLVSVPVVCAVSFGA